MKLDFNFDAVNKSNSQAASQETEAAVVGQPQGQKTAAAVSISRSRGS